MSNIVFPLVLTDDNKFLVTIDLTLYSKEAITATSYKYTDKFYVHLKMECEDKVVATFEGKDNNVITADIPKKFCTDLVDQQLRVDINKQFGNIRDMIVKEAFKPVNK